MRKLISLIRELWYIRKYTAGTLVRDKPELYQYDAVMRMMKILRIQKYPGWMRDMIAKALKMHRSYEVNEEWTDAKLKYLQYQIDHPDVYKSVEEVPVGGWITVVGHAPIRGERYNEYYAGGWGGTPPGTYKVKARSKYRWEEEAIELYGETMSRAYNEMRPATEQEVESAKYQYWVEHDKAQEARYNGYLQQKQMVIDQYSWLGTRETII